MPLADWTVPFTLTSSVYSATTLSLNTPVVFTAGTGTFFLRGEGCSLTNQVRQTKEFVPQEDGSILHRRYVAGMEMGLAVQLWQDTETIACDTLQQEMLDSLMGYAYGLLNAGDNQGRVSWVPSGGSSVVSGSRMLDDIRLLSYPVESQQPGSPYEVAFTVDCALPYAEDLTQSTIALDDVGVTVTNYGNRPVYPVWQLTGPFSQQSLTNMTNGDVFYYDDTFPGAPVIGPNEYIEIDTFRNTAYLNGSGANCKPGINMELSDFFSIPPGSHTIVLSDPGSTGTALWNNAFA